VAIGVALTTSLSDDLEALLASAATEHLREESDQVWAEEFQRIIGTTDRLPAAFAAQLKSNVKRAARALMRPKR
jgi:monoamine oxidase